MIKTIKLFLFFALILLIGCSNNSNDKSAANNEKIPADKSKTETEMKQASNTNAQSDDIIANGR